MARNSTNAASADSDSASASVSPEPQQLDESLASQTNSNLIDDENGKPVEKKFQKERKIQHRFIPARQIIFLKAIRAHKPWAKPHGSVTSSWENLASDYCKEVGNSNAINAEGARRHWERLLKLYNQGEKEILRVSGTENEYTELEDLLGGLASTANNFKDTSKDDDSTKVRKKRDRPDIQEAEARMKDLFTDKQITKVPRTSTPPLLPMPLSPIDDSRSEEMLSDTDRIELGLYNIEKRLKNKSRTTEDFVELKKEFRHNNTLLQELLQTRKNDVALLQKMLDLEERRLSEQTAERLQRERFYECQFRLSGLTGEGRKSLDGRPGSSADDGKSDELSRTA